ncbi:WbqC family protein [Chromohalobacter israelensis]|uniref:WbqC family protein n=1 Tax=Chromohalobacter israelensis TaxID=141390 RepID=UPI000D915D33|nr:WbqC family protein [Chromohalobacter salexigens]PWW36482.1 WbqC-like protein [Chromohalobacter salexigens]
MKAAVMQPYFLPYIGYFQLMHYADIWVVFDDIQFIDKGWVNRNRVLHPEDEKRWQYITIPLKGRHQFSKINEVKINDEKNWRKEIRGKVSHYKKRRAPYYNQGLEVLNKCLSMEESNLSEFVINSLEVMKRFLGISTPIVRQPVNLVEGGKVSHAGLWALEICKQIGASHYINPIGGQHLFNINEYKEKGVDVSFLGSNLTPYYQKRHCFEGGLSILDMIMWEGLEGTSCLVETDFKIVKV